MQITIIKLKMITVSEVAAEKLKEIISKQKKPQNTLLRIAFGGYG